MTRTTFTDPNELIAKASDRFLSQCLRDGLTYPMIITLVTGDGAVQVHRFESDHISQMLCKEASGTAFRPPLVFTATTLAGRTASLVLDDDAILDLVTAQGSA